MDDTGHGRNTARPPAPKARDTRMGLSRISIRYRLILAAAVTAAACRPAAPPPDLHTSLLVLDAHADIASPLDTPDRTDTYDVGT